MNITDHRIQWHPAFDASLQIELAEESEYLRFESEHLLSKKPLQIDILVIKKLKEIQIRKNLGQIFKTYNIVEYKSPDDSLCIDDFYKVYGYACIYKAETGMVNEVSADEITLTFACYHYPREMLMRLKKERRLTVVQKDSGIYYLEGDFFPVQLILIPELSRTSNYWMQSLRNNLKAGGEIRKLIEQYERNKCSKLHQALVDAVMRANWEEAEAEKEMCEALKELFADELQESRNMGKSEGKAEGKVESILELLRSLDDLPESLTEQIKEERDLDILRKWLLAAAKAKSIEEFERNM